MRNIKYFLSIEVEFFFCDITDPVSKDELEKQEETINTQDISTHFYKVVENEDFIKFKGHIEDKDGQYFDNRRLNFGLMFDFKKNGSHSIESLQNFKIAVSAKDLGEKEEIEKIDPYVENIENVISKIYQIHMTIWLRLICMRIC